MNSKIPLQVFLSYRSHWQDKRAGLEKAIEQYNGQSDSRYHITLRVSESELQQGDSIIEFMDTLATARFVILMLGKEYFESPYCLHELLEITRNGKAEERLFPLPVKVDPSLEKITWETMLGALQGEYHISDTKENGYCRDRLRELQAGVAANQLNGLSPEEQDSEIQKKLEESYKRIVRPLIDTLTHEYGSSELVDALVREVDQVFAAERQALYDTLSAEIEVHLDEVQQEDRASLQDILNLPTESSSQQLAVALLDKKGQEGMAVIQDWVDERHEKIPLEKTKDWKNFFSHAEAICGWLLLQSVSPSWWVHNKISFVSGKNHKGHIDLDMQAPAYAEVVISRELIKKAEFGLDSGHNLVPACFSGIWEDYMGNDSHLQDGFILDANPKALQEALLLPILYELKLGPSDPQRMGTDPEKLLQELIRFAKVSRRPKYYIVTSRYLQQLQQVTQDGISLLERINRELGDKLVFVTCGAKDPKGIGAEPAICETDEEELLARLLLILARNRQREQEITRRS